MIGCLQVVYSKISVQNYGKLFGSVSPRLVAASSPCYTGIMAKTKPTPVSRFTCTHGVCNYRLGKVSNGHKEYH